MGVATQKLDQLRPVTFRLKADPQGAMQYGLIAEEVAKVYPELVLRGADGTVNGVRYEELAQMLLNEVQQQKKEIAQLRQQLAEVKELEQQVAELRELSQAVKAPQVKLPAAEERAGKMQDPTHTVLAGPERQLRSFP